MPSQNCTREPFTCKHYEVFWKNKETRIKEQFHQNSCRIWRFTSKAKTYNQTRKNFKKIVEKLVSNHFPKRLAKVAASQSSYRKQSHYVCEDLYHIENFLRPGQELKGFPSVFLTEPPPGCALCSRYTYRIAT